MVGTFQRTILSRGGAVKTVPSRGYGTVSASRARSWGDLHPVPSLMLYRFGCPAKDRLSGHHISGELPVAGEGLGMTFAPHSAIAVCFGHGTEIIATTDRAPCVIALGVLGVAVSKLVGVIQPTRDFEDFQPHVDPGRPRGLAAIRRFTRGNR